VELLRALAEVYRVLHVIPQIFLQISGMTGMLSQLLVGQVEGEILVVGEPENMFP
jgi:hypothetical protein